MPMSPPIRALSTVVVLLAAGQPAFAQPTGAQRSIGSFSRLRVENGIDITLNPAARESLSLEVDGYELEDIVTEVVGDELRISVVDGARRVFSRGSRSARVNVDFVSLTAIEASGGSDVRGRGEMSADDLVVHASGGSDVDLAAQARRLELAATGGSDVTLRGKAESLEVTASGGSDLSAAGLETRSAVLQVSGGSDATVTVTDSVTVNASGGSDVHVAGNPAQRNVRSDRSSDVVWR
jgi:Putative auto-transporter adhesin, head GIN domain